MPTTLTSTGITFPDATTQSTAPVIVGASGQAFTTNGTFTIPTGVTKVKVTVVGGGGGGSTGATVSKVARVGGSGGGGGTAIAYLTGLTPGNTLAVTIGGGGAGGSCFNGNGGTASTVASGTQSISTITGRCGGRGS